MSKSDVWFKSDALFRICYICVNDIGERINTFDYVVAENRDEALLFFRLHELIRNEKREDKLNIDTIYDIVIVKRM